MKKAWIALSLFFLSHAFAGPKIIFVGDSLTDGYRLSRDQAFPALIKNMLDKDGFTQVEITNVGESGITTSGLPGRVASLFRKHKPQIMFLCLGANDGLRGITPSTTQTNLRGAIQKALDNNIKVILAGMKVPLNYGKKYGDTFEAIFPVLAKEFPSIDFIPFLLEGVVGGEKENANDKNKLMQGDGMHPTAEGHIVIAKNIYPIILRNIK